MFPTTISGVLEWATAHLAAWTAAVTGGGGSANGLDTAKITAMQTALDNADASRDAAIAAREASKSATITQDSDISTMMTLFAEAVADIKAYANRQADPSAVYAEMELPVPDTDPTKHNPVQPIKLTATPDATGNVKLEWDGNGNAYRTVYEIEGSADGVTWAIIGTATAQKKTLSGFTVGSTYRFRVSATINNQTSVPSSVVVIWDSGDSGSLSIAA